MTYTIDRIKELVPEATSVIQSGEWFRLTVGGKRYYSVEPIMISLLTTRAEVERLKLGIDSAVQILSSVKVRSVDVRNQLWALSESLKSLGPKQ